MSLERALENTLKIYKNEHPDFQDQAFVLTNTEDGLQVRSCNMSQSTMVLFLEIAKMNILKGMTENN